MQSLEEFFADLGLIVSAPALDGQIHRVDHQEKPGEKTGWYKGWELPYKVVCAGDWRTGRKVIWKGHAKATISREEKAFLSQQIKEARIKAEWELLERQRQVAIEAKSILEDTRSAGEHPYLTRKMVQAYGIRQRLGNMGPGELLIPMLDEAGVVQGIQRILEDGQKFFLPGQKVSGTAYRIPGDDSRVIICEGFATGASIAEATGALVYVAFNAGNLLEVMRWVRPKHSTAMILVAGDEDQWTQGNPGRQKAQAAADLGQCAVVFPVFQDLDGKPTDFNDLHVREGIDIVLEQLSAPNTKRRKMAPLGVSGDHSYVYSYKNRTVVQFTNYSSAQFLHVEELEHWRKAFPSMNEKDAGKVDWDCAKNEIIQACNKLGAFDPRRVRGTGVWLSDRDSRGSKNTCLMNDAIVVNTGAKLFLNGAETTPSDMSSDYFYTKGPALPTITGAAATVAELAPFVEACEALRWQDPAMGKYLAGWITIAPLAGVLPVRPHMWVTGDYGAGKSTVLEKIVKRMVAGYQAYQGETTSSGIRHSIKGSSIPIIFDEFEPDQNKKSQERIASVVELFRQAWSPTDGTITKGTTTGSALSYHACFSALVASIKVFMDNAADISRFTIIELDPHGSKEADWIAIKAKLAKLTKELSLLLWRRSVRMVPVILESYETIRQAMVSRGETQRWASQHGMLLAGYWSLLADRVITEEEARELGDVKGDEPIPEAEDCLTRLLTSKVRFEIGKEFSIGEVLNNVLDGKPDDRLAHLRLHGILVDDHKILISTNHEYLHKLYSNTKWNVSWRKILKRLPAAKSGGAKYFFGDHTAKTIIIPLVTIRT